MPIDKQEFKSMAPMLKKVREHLGFTLKEAATLLESKLETPPTKFDSPEARLRAWEEAEVTPTFNQIKILFEKVYRYPYMALAYKELPRDNSILTEYRRDDVHPLTAEKRRILRIFEQEIQSRQDLLRDIAEEEEWPILDFIGSCSLEMSPAFVAFKMRELLNYPFQVQSKDNLLKMLRNKLEDIGVFVFYKNNLGQSHHPSTRIDYSGLALSDEKVPIICVNNAHDDSRKLFTLIHEFCHLLLGAKSICDFDAFDEKCSFCEIETFCNNVASQFFITDEELDKNWDPRLLFNGKNSNRSQDLGSKFIHVIKSSYYKDLISYSSAREILGNLGELQ